MTEDRAITLLKATLEILNEASKGPCVRDVFELTAHYDGTDCDGFRIREDIENYLEFEAPQKANGGQQ